MTTAIKNIYEIDRSKLVDISTVKINPNAPKAERIIDYERQTGNPRHYLDGNIAVLISFSDTSTTIEDSVVGYLRGV